MSDKEDDLRHQMSRGFSALNALIKAEATRIDRLETRIGDIQRQQGSIDADLDNLKEEVTGKHDLVSEVARIKGKEEALKERQAEEAEEKKLRIERWKASAPIYVAILTTTAALITGIINIILHLGSGGGH